MRMRRLLLIAVTLGCCGVLGAYAQVHGVPPSVTSLAPGRPTPGPRASVTSLGPFGFGVPSANIFFGSQFPTSRGPWSYFPGQGHSGRHPGTNLQYQYGAYPYGPVSFGPYSYGGYPYGSGYGYGYGLPYYMYDSGADVLDYQQMPAQSQAQQQQPMMLVQPPGPTVFDGHGSQGYVPSPEPMYDESAGKQPAPAPRPVATATPEPQVKTVLVFRDGHQLEITNYAIADGTLLNLSGGGPRKIPISELDVKATMSANDERGVEFSLPTT
jgi:hypothetical protein